MVHPCCISPHRVVNETGVGNSPGAKMPYIGDSAHVQVPLQSWFPCKLNCLQPCRPSNMSHLLPTFQPRQYFSCQTICAHKCFCTPPYPSPHKFPLPKKWPLKWHKSFPSIYNQTLALWQIGRRRQYVSTQPCDRRDIDGP